MKTNDAGRYIPVNGLNMYCEVYGEGQPLILVHGGFGSVDMFAQLIPQLSANRQVIAVEMQGHAHTADIDRPFSFETLADDIAALIGALGFESADVLGYSLGGGVALQTILRHPALVRKLLIVSAPFKSSGWYPEVLAGQRAITAEFAKAWTGSPMHQAYTSVAPNPQDWTALVVKTGQLLSRDYDWSKELALVQAPLMIVAGDADSIRPAHALEFFELLGGGQKDGGWDGSGLSTARLVILPGTTHFNILSSALLAPALTQFLDAAI